MPDAKKDALAAILDLLPAECWVSRTVEIRCTDYVGGTFSNGAVFTEDMCCLPCRIRAVLTSVTSPAGTEANRDDVSPSRAYPLVQYQPRERT